MLKKFAFLAAFAFSSASFASAIDGTWAFPIVKSGGFTFEAQMALTDTTATISNVCSQGATTVSVSVTVPIQITDTQITTLGAAQNTVSKDGVDCNVSAEASTMDYVLVNPDTLTLSSNGQKMNVTRVH